jgi:uncharacterized protein YkwD
MASTFAYIARALSPRAPALLLLVSSLVLGACRSVPPAPAPRAAAPARTIPRLADAALEREVLEELNRVRSNPARFASYLESTLPQYEGAILRRPTETMPVRTREGKVAVREAIAALKSVKPMPTFKLSTGMTSGARDHVRDIGPRGRLDHEGKDGSQSWHRVSRYGKWGGRISENMSFGPETGRDVVAALLIDDGVPSRGHRKNILDPEVRIVGVACGTHKTYRRMCDVVHAAKFEERTTTAASRQ